MDDTGRPYCSDHAPARSEVYATLVGAYSEARKAVAAAVAGGLMSPDDAKYYYELWDGSQMDP